MFIVFYISGHGFGHAARAVEVINAIGARDRSVRVAVRTSAPSWFLEASLESVVERVDGEIDTGVVQPDSLSVDEDGTARRARAFYAAFATKVEHERRFLQRIRADVVVGDIPPLAFAAARAAGVPAIALGNFTWDWIYEGYPGFDAIAPGVCQTIADAQAKVTVGLRLPFCGGFASMPIVEDVPLVARRARLERADTRTRLGLRDDRPVALATFGGHGGTVPLDKAASDGRVTIVTTTYEQPANAVRQPNLRVFSTRELNEAGVGYTDLLAASDVVATKLGYGIVSECIANRVPLLYTSRGRFREQEIFEREMPAVVQCEAIDRDRFLAGDWSEAIERLLSKPRPAADMASNGAEVAAERICREL